MHCARGVVVVLVLAASCFAAPNEPTTVDDKPLGHWVESLRSEDQSVRKLAIERIHARCLPCYPALGWDPRGAPILQRMKAAGPPLDLLDLEIGFAEGNPLLTLHELRHEAKPHIAALSGLLRQPDDGLREAAAELLMFLGPDARESLPELAAAVRERPSGGLARSLLHVCPPTDALGPGFLEKIAAACAASERQIGEEKDADRHRWGTAAESAMVIAMALIKSGRSEIELPTLVEVTRPKYPELARRVALLTLRHLAPDSRSVVGALRERLADADREFRLMTARTIIWIESPRTAPRESLKSMKLDRDDTAELQKWVEKVEKQLGEVSPTDEEDDVGREDAQKTFGAEVSDALKLLTYAPPLYLRQTLRALGQFGPPAAGIIPSLAEFLKSPDPATREAAREAIRRIDPNHPELPKE